MSTSRRNNQRDPNRRRDDEERDGAGKGCFGTLWDIVTFAWLFNLFSGDD